MLCDSIVTLFGNIYKIIFYLEITLGNCFVCGVEGIA